MNLVLMRIDFFTRPEVVGLPFDYKLILAIITAHPWQTPAGILCYSRPAARVLNGGLDYETVLATLPALEKLGLLIFDDRTMEVWLTDFFEVNLAPDQPGNSKYLRGQIASFRSCSSQKIKMAWQAAAIVAPLEKQRSVAVPSNYLSSLPDAAGVSLKASLTAVAIALICNPDVSLAGSACLSFSLLGDMMGLDMNTVRCATQMLNELEIVFIDKRTEEYWFKRWFSITGKLTSLEKIGAVALVTKTIRSGYIRRAIYRAISQKTEGKYDHLFESRTSVVRKKKQVLISFSECSDNSFDESSASDAPDFPSLTTNPPTSSTWGGGMRQAVEEDALAVPTADEVVAAIRWKYQQVGGELGPGLECVLRRRWSGKGRDSEHSQSDLNAVVEHRKYLQRISANKMAQQTCSKPVSKVNAEEQRLIGKSIVTKNGCVVLVRNFGATIAKRGTPLSKILIILKSSVSGVQFA